MLLASPSIVLERLKRSIAIGRLYDCTLMEGVAKAVARYNSDPCPAQSDPEAVEIQVPESQIASYWEDFARGHFIEIPNRQGLWKIVCMGCHGGDSKLGSVAFVKRFP